LHETLDVFSGKDVRDGPWPLFATEDRRWQFMGRILGTDVAGKSNNFPKPAGTLINRFCQSGPLDCDIGANAVFSSFMREGGKTLQKTALALELEPASTAYSQVGLHGLSYHGCTSGQG
jgi:hypothetical protein